MFHCLLILLTFLSSALGSAPNVELLWGLPDRVTYVGQAFQYQIPPAAFHGNIQRFKVVDVLEEGLPGWLGYDEQSGRLFGVPALADVGPLALRVEAYSQPLNRTHVRMVADAMTITVKEETLGSRMAAFFDRVAADPSNPAKDAVFCEKGVPEIVFTLVLADPGQLADMSADQRMDTLDRVSKVFGVALPDLRLYDRGYVSELKRSVLRSGRGSEKADPSNLGSIMVSWLLGCGLNLDADERSRLEQLTNLVRNSGDGPVKTRSWNVATHLLPEHRRKRGIFDFLKTPTAAPDPGPQASTPGTTTTVRITPGPPPRKTTTAQGKPPATPAVAPNEKPVPKPQNLETIKCHFGEYCSYAVSENVFMDREDGDARNLKLVLAPLDESQARPWVVFSPESLLIEAMVPPASEAEPESSSIKYRLTATDSQGASGSLVVLFQLEPGLKEVGKLLHQFSISLDLDHASWLTDGRMQVDFFSRLAKYLGGSQSDITVTGVESGSVKISWKNNTFIPEDCMRNALYAIGRKLATDKGRVSSQLKAYMSAYRVTNASYENLGKCVVRPAEPARGDEMTPAVSVPPEKEPASGSGFYTTAIPIIVIVALLLLAAVVAVCLWRRSKRGKKGASPSQAYMSRGGKPVVFPGEVHEPNEDRDATTTSPMLLKEERPPLPSSDYAASGGLSTFGRGPDTSVGVSPLYSPPPHPAADAPLNNGTRSPRPRTTTPQNARSPQNLHLLP